MINDFLKFCKEKIYLWGICLIAILAYGLLFATVAIGIDDESMEIYLWGGELLKQDRVGWIIANKIFPSYTFLPWWTSLLGIIVVIVGMLLWLYGIDRKLNSIFPKGIMTIAGGIGVSFPYIAKFAIFNGNMITMGYVVSAH